MVVGGRVPGSKWKGFPSLRDWGKTPGEKREKSSYLPKQE